MTSENFTYWLQGFTELSNGAHPTPEQWKMIKEHLALVFIKVTPPLEIVNSEPTYCQSYVPQDGVGTSSANWPAGPLLKGVSVWKPLFTPYQIGDRATVYSHSC